MNERINNIPRHERRELADWKKLYCINDDGEKRVPLWQAFLKSPDVRAAPLKDVVKAQQKLAKLLEQDTNGVLMYHGERKRLSEARAGLMGLAEVVEARRAMGHFEA